jgi:ABC-type bacteriocin/lantibiotic exporter with double-glycine peptidase domain
VKKVPNWKTLSIENLSFKYESEKADIMHLDNINLTFLHKENIAVIGESGSGKTTFLKVIHGMYSNASGRILFDKNKPIETNFENIDLKTTLVPQEPEIFSSSIRENITLGLDYKEKDIISATDLAEFTETVEKLPNKYNSIINEKGVNLSGGQKQRLALARALLFAENKDIILLDESTSSVDPENEVKIYKNLLNKYENKVVIASIHKMNLLKYFDRIIIFEAGKVSDSGTFDELLKSNKKFSKDWNEYVSQHKAS